MAARVMKSAKANKSKGRVVKVARGPRARSMVFKGSREKTSGGLRRDDLVLNRCGKVVSKKASAHGKRSFRHIESWLDSCMEARRALHLTGFVPINGKSLQGKALYVKAKTLWKARQDGAAALGLSLSTVASPRKVATPGTS